MSFIYLGKRQAESFEKDNIRYMKALPFVEVPQIILLQCYNIFVSSRKIKKIEELPVQDKQTIFDTAKEISMGKLGKEQLVRLCKCLYSLEFILNN